jgi:hypothetical protein
MDIGLQKLWPFQYDSNLSRTGQITTFASYNMVAG